MRKWKFIKIHDIYTACNVEQEIERIESEGWVLHSWHFSSRDTAYFLFYKECIKEKQKHGGDSIRRRKRKNTR